MYLESNKVYKKLIINILTIATQSKAKTQDSPEAVRGAYLIIKFL